MSFIYKITNNVNNKVYIGKTAFSIEKRFKEHCRDAFKERQEKRPLYAAMRKYGIENFSIEIIEECEDLVSSDRECYWISQYKAFEKGYNATLGGDGKFLYNHQEIIDALRLYPYPKEIAERFGCSVDLIYNIAKNANIQCYNIGQEKNINQKKMIAQFDKNEKFIQNFNSVADAAKWCFENNFCKTLNSGVRSHIAECANSKRKSAYNYLWKYI